MSTLLDTNVLSELMLPRPSRAVRAWMASHRAASLWISSVTEAELWFGIRRLPVGTKRRQLEAALIQTLDEDFNGRIWPFDSAAAKVYATIMSQRRAAGRPMSQFDCQIASIASVRGTALATRNVADFANCGLVVHDPWAAESVT